MVKINICINQCSIEYRICITYSHAFDFYFYKFSQILNDINEPQQNQLGQTTPCHGAHMASGSSWINVTSCIKTQFGMDNCRIRVGVRLTHGFWRVSQIWAELSPHTLTKKRAQLFQGCKLSWLGTWGVCGRVSLNHPCSQKKKMSPTQVQLNSDLKFQ